MKQLLTIAAVLAAVFASTFLILQATGLITIGDVEQVLAMAHDVSPIYVAATVVFLLFIDLFIAVPTLTISILSGYFLGFTLGGLSAAAGMLFAGVTGYAICWMFGPGLLIKIYKDEEKLKRMQKIFNEHGVAVLLMCRAVPILPEVCCCLSGANRMPFLKFLFFYSLSTIPYAFIASYAGSQSTLSDPKPAVFTAMAISFVLWVSWLVFLRRNYGKKPSEIPV